MVGTERDLIMEENTSVNEDYNEPPITFRFSPYSQIIKAENEKALILQLLKRQVQLSCQISMMLSKEVLKDAVAKTNADKPKSEEC